MPLSPAAVKLLRAGHVLPALAERLPRDAILVFDGVFLMRPELIDRWDLRIFVSTALEKTVMNEPRDSVEGREGDSTSEAQHARDAAGNVVDDARLVQSPAGNNISADAPALRSSRFRSRDNAARFQRSAP